MLTNKYVRLAAVSAAALIVGAALTEAHAGAFGIREQSTQFQGGSFAGDAAGRALTVSVNGTDLRF